MAYEQLSCDLKKKKKILVVDNKSGDQEIIFATNMQFLIWLVKQTEMYYAKPKHTIFLVNTHFIFICMWSLSKMRVCMKI